MSGNTNSDPDRVDTGAQGQTELSQPTPAGGAILSADQVAELLQPECNMDGDPAWQVLASYAALTARLAAVAAERDAALGALDCLREAVFAREAGYTRENYQTLAAAMDAGWRVLHPGQEAPDGR